MGYAKQRATCTKRTRAKLRQRRPPETESSLRAAAKCGACFAALLGNRMNYYLRRASRIHPHFAKQRGRVGLFQRFPNRSDRRLARLAGTDAHRLLYILDENLA